VFAIDQGDEIWLIDAGSGHLGRVERIFRWMQQEQLDPHKISKVFLTHAHADHMCGLVPLRKLVDVEVFVHEQDRNLLAGDDHLFMKTEFDAAGDLRSEFFPVPLWLICWGARYSMGKYPQITNPTVLREGDRIKGSRFTIEVIHTPGHTPGHSAYWLPEVQALYVGDLLDPYYDHKPPINMVTSSFQDFNTSMAKLLNFKIEYLCPAHAKQIHRGIESNREIVTGTIGQLDFTKQHTIELLRQHPGMRLIDFKGAFSKRLYQFLEQMTAPYAVIRELMTEGKVKREGKRFFWVGDAKN
jgi:glyoxylase-like metal-dependent hydrolase (beta-lactamase superfamily II)